MVSRSLFNMQFWLLTFGLAFLWTVTLSVAYPTMDGNQNQLLPGSAKDSGLHERDCKALCKQCGCMGFYCGEECICECNNETSNTECINNMQTNAQKLEIPFQLLIQGHSRNRFIRKALQYSQDGNSIAAPEEANRNKRSTVLIYKPASQNSLQNGVDDAHKLANSKDESFQRQKRSVGQLDWFNDIANTLVRPAPIISSRRSGQSMHSAEEVAKTQPKRGANRDEMDRSWFADSPSLLLRPAPLFKRQRVQADSDTNSSARNSNDDIDSFESPIRAVEKFPEVLKETLRSLQESAIGSDANNDFGESLRSRIKESTNILQSRLADNNLEFLPANGVIRDNIQQTLSQIFPTNTNTESQPPVLQRSAPPKETPRKKFIWFRPVRFLQRVQQAINNEGLSR